MLNAYVEKCQKRWLWLWSLFIFML